MNKHLELIVTDLDGSLLDSKKNCPEEIHHLIDELHKKNILFGICSGRQYASIHDKLNQRDDILYLGENGGICIFKNKVIHFNSLPQDSIDEFVKLTRSIDGCTAVLCGQDKAYTESKNAAHLEKIRMFYQSFDIVDDLLDIHEPFCKISVLDLKGSEHNCYPYFKKYQNDFEVIVSDAIWMDICCKNQSKGNTLKKAAEILNIDLNKAVAFGDYFNDVELLNAVNYSFAMKNAHPDVKKQARWIAPSNDDKGVVKVIETILNHLHEEVEQ